MSVKFQLSGGKAADILANSIEGFLARTPEEFLEFLRAQLPDPSTGKPDPTAVPEFLGSHPGAASFVGRLMQKPVPASYAQTSDHAEHAFRFTAADGSSRFGRYHWLPDAGDPIDDPRALWPADRPRVELGRLEIEAISPTSADDERRLIFDPTNRTEGTEPSNDPILLARSAAYAISYERRTRGQ